MKEELDNIVFDLYSLTDSEKDLIRDRCRFDIDYYYQKENSFALKPITGLRHSLIGKQNDNNLRNAKPDSIEMFLYTFCESFGYYLRDGKEIHYEVIRSRNTNWENEEWNDYIGIVFTLETLGTSTKTPQYEEWHQLIQSVSNFTTERISQNIYTDNLFRFTSEYYTVIIKRNEQRLWTKTAAREDAEAVFMNINKKQFTEI